MNATPDASARKQFWSVVANPSAYAHESWRDKLADWPDGQRFSEASLLTPPELIALFGNDQSRFNQLLVRSGLVAYAPAIRRVISGQDLSRLNALLTSQGLAALVSLKPSLALPVQHCPTSVEPLLADGLVAARQIGIGLLAGCTNGLGGAWSHCLKIRVADNEAFLIDQAPSLSHEELPERLAWFSHDWSALAIPFANDSSAD